MTPRTLIDAFEADVWAGLVVVFGPSCGAAIRLAVELEGRRVEPRDLFLVTHEVGPHAADGSYARVSFDLTHGVPEVASAPPQFVAAGEATLTWEWWRAAEGRLSGRITAARPMRVWLEGACPWDWSARWRAEGDALVADVEGAGGATRATHTVVLQLVEAAPAWSGAAEDSRSARLAVDLEQGVLRFEVTLGPDEASFLPLPPATISPRVRVTGAWDGLADSITNTVQWMTLLQPELARRYVPAGRRWLFPAPHGGRDDWTIFAWDGFFNALLASLESPPLARDTLAAVLETQYPSGNVPNWRSRRAGTPDRSQPPIGAFVVLQLALRSGDASWALAALPYLERWHVWWARRRRPSGLYAWGSDPDSVAAWVPPWEVGASPRQKAAWESGQDDLPNWDDATWDAATNTLAMDCVDLSALLALDAECLGRLHQLAGTPERAEAFAHEHASLCARINERLWDDERGLYLDRLGDGTWSRRVAATNILPLLAGAASPARVARVLATLLDPHEFWGEWIVPTISRRDPAFADQQYWRGTIWPPTNLLAYEALRRVRADEPAATLAARSVALFLGDWRTHQLSRENFSSIDGRGGGHRHQSWGPLFSWTGLSELATVTPWDGLRLGAVHIEEASTVRGLELAGHSWEVELGPDRMIVQCDGRPWCSSEGPMCLRHVAWRDGAWHARASVRRTTVVRDARGATTTLAPGEGEITLDT